MGLESPDSNWLFLRVVRDDLERNDGLSRNFYRSDDGDVHRCMWRAFRRGGAADGAERRRAL